MTRDYKGILRLNGKSYRCEVVDGERLIEGMPADEFIENLSFIERGDLAFLGVVARDDFFEGKQPDTQKYQKIADELYQQRNN